MEHYYDKMIFRFFYDNNLGINYLDLLDSYFKTNYNLNHKFYSFNISKNKKVLESFNVNYIPSLWVSSNKNSKDIVEVSLFDTGLEKTLKELMKT